jgi:CIC family chloride channel protein
VIGGLVGTAFGLGAREVLGDPSIQPAAFALVGMGTFYGALAHVPLSALVLVAELAGSYDLLVPMMLSIAIAYVALRRHTLYPAQVASRFASAAHGPSAGVDVVAALSRRTAAELLVPAEVGPVEERASVDALLAAAADARLQRVVAVRGAAGLDGLVELSAAADLPAAERHWVRARDAAVRFTAVEETATWAEVAAVLDRCGASQVPVLRGGDIIGWIGDRELRRAVLER